MHVLNLDTVGGVEELFVHFLVTAKKLSTQKQHVLVTSNKPHPFFTKHLTHADSLTVEKYIGPLKAPRFLRSYIRDRYLKKVAPDATILWNRMEEYAWPGRIIYYEHGASWIADRTKTRRSFFTSVDQIIANSYAAKRILELKWDIKQPIHIIENPLKPTISVSAAPKKAKTALTLGYIGRLIPLKGVSLILHALHALTNEPVSLKIAGDGPEKEALMKEAKRLNIPVTFYGAIKDVSAFYDSIDVLIVPSIREPLGLVAQEAALRGCPVIAAKVDGLPEVVQNEKTGFLLEPELDIASYPLFGGNTQNLPDLVYNPTLDTLTAPKLLTPQSIAATVIKLLNSPALFETMSQNAILFAQKRPTFLQYTQNLLSLLTQI